MLLDHLRAEPIWTSLLLCWASSSTTDRVDVSKDIDPAAAGVGKGVHWLVTGVQLGVMNPVDRWWLRPAGVRLAQASGQSLPVAASRTVVRPASRRSAALGPRRAGLGLAKKRLDVLLVDEGQGAVRAVLGYEELGLGRTERR
jgi:hypothetical protein